MDVLRFLAKGFGNLIIFFSLTILFMGLFAHYGFNNIDMVFDSAKENIPIILRENKDVLIEESFNGVEIDRAELERSCEQGSELGEEFCNKLPSLETEDDIKNELVEISLSEAEKELINEFEVLENDFNSDSQGISDYLIFIIPGSILFFLLGSLLIFYSQKFDWKSSLWIITIQTSVISFFSAFTNYFLKNVTPEKIENIVTKFISSEENPLAYISFRLVSEILSDWLNVICEKVFIISLIAFIISFSLMIVFLVFKLKKRKKKKKKKRKKKKKKKLKLFK